MGSPNTLAEQNLGLILELLRGDLTRLMDHQSFGVQITGIEALNSAQLIVHATARPGWNELDIPLLPSHVRTAALRAIGVLYQRKPWGDVVVEMNTREIE